MRFRFTNIGKVKEADIQIDGLTVITGENDSGKSTIAKTLYSAITATKNIGGSIVKYKKDAIYKNLLVIEKWLRNNMPPQENNNANDINSNKIYFYSVLEALSNPKRIINVKKITKEALENKYNSDELISVLKVFDVIMQKIIGKDFMVEFNFEDFEEEIKKYGDISRIKSNLDQIKEVQLITEDKEEIIRDLYNQIFKLEFSNEIENLYKNEDEKSIVEIGYPKKVLEIHIKENEIEKIEKTGELYEEEAIYIETPFIFEDNRYQIIQILDLIANDSAVPKNERIMDHKTSLSKLIIEDEIEENLNPIENIIKKKKIEKFKKILNDKINGDFKYSKEKKRYVLERKGKEISLDNLATGIKAIGILKILINKSKFEKNNVIMIDEPEVHLHPKWQIEYARIIVELVKEFEANILLTSHSPFFIEAIQKFSEKYKIVDKTNFYFMNNEENGSHSENVNNNLEKVYEELSAAYDLLDDYTLGDL